MNKIGKRLLKHYLLFFSLITVSSIIFCVIWSKKDTITLIADTSGYIALIFLSASLVTGTIKMSLNQINPISSDFRRDLGITGGVLAILHSITGLFVHLRGHCWQYFLNKTAQAYSIRLDNFGLANYLGLISALIILVLLLSSNNYSIKKLNPKNWKNLQRLSYVMFILAIIHCIFYRIISSNFSLIYTLYLPLVSIVMLFQSYGVYLKFKERRILITRGI